MAKYFKSKKWKKGLTAGLAVALSATLSLGILSACGKIDTEDDDTEKEPTLPTDTQLIKNGDFEFYSEMTKKDKQDDRRVFINSPQSWSASSESPSSESASGVIDIDDWAFMTKSTFPLIRNEDKKTTNDEGEEVDVEEGDGVLTEGARQYATAHWDEASLYDRLEFYNFFDIDSDSDFDKYDDYQYSIDFDDVRYLVEDMKKQEGETGESIKLHYTDAEMSDETVEKGSGVLMIHNRHYTESEKVSGTSKSYTSSTDVTLNAGTAAKVSVWVKTIGLEHDNKVAVAKRGGAYISVANTVGSTSLDQMQINDIITANNAANNAANNGWQQYTVYIRANNFATTTFHIILGLGRGTSDDRYEAIDGIALFDDLECELITDGDFETAINGSADPETAPIVPQSHQRTLEDKGDARIFYSTNRTTGEFDAESAVYALDLKADFDPLDLGLTSDDFSLTEETSGNRTYTSKDIDKALDDNRTTEEEQYRSILGEFTLDALKAEAKEGETVKNGYLQSIVEKDFANYPFEEGTKIVMMLSTNGAAYTAKLDLPAFEIAANSRKLVSFWVKTSALRSGTSGAGATLIDGDNKPAITPFDSTAVDPVDAGEAKDIWDGWVQCFFYVENDSDVQKSFTLNLTYGPTAIADAERNAFGEGYAAFANFETYDLTRAQYNYAQTGTYAQKTTLTGEATEPSAFDNAAASGNTLEEGLARPVNYTGTLAGSDLLDENGATSPSLGKELAEEYGIYAGMLSSKYAEKYLELDNAWMTALNAAAGTTADANTWWKNLFGSKGSSANAAYQPLVLLNTSDAAQPAYGFFAKETSVSANSATKISLRVKAKQGTTAYIYLISGSANEGRESLKAALPSVTYWYDDEGNIVNMDPEAKDFEVNGKILYTLQENGLYLNAQDTADTKLYANLSNFDTNDEGHLVTSAGTVAFYVNDGKYYAHREQNNDGTFVYEESAAVTALPTTGDFIRYNYPAEGYPECAIKVEGMGEWTTVSFYINAGTEEKNYRLELWAGQRDYIIPAEGETAPADQVGFPAGGYVFFDRCTTETVSNFQGLLSETEKAMLGYKDGTNAYPYRDADDAEKLAQAFGRYYTFTLYDSPDFLLYDKTQDENNDGNPWRNYKQSDESEQLAFLIVEDKEGDVLGTAFPTVSMFIDYSVSEQDLDTFRAPSLNDEADADEPEDDDHDDTTTGGEPGNIWLYIASGALAFALVFTIVAVLVRRAWAKRKKTVKVKAPKERAVKAAKKEEAPAKEEPISPAKETPDENDPYNE